MKDRREAILQLLLRLRAMDLAPPLMAAFEAVPRQNFAPVMHIDASYGPIQLPIECGQTMSSPDMLARMLSALAVEKPHRVLEIGTGSGYQAAVLGHLAAKVQSVERYRTLADKARHRLEQLGLANVLVEFADGKDGRPGEVFDRIVANCAYPDIPRHFLEQLSVNGVAVAPVGPPLGAQTVLRLVKVGSRFEATPLFEVRLQPFATGVAKAI